MIAIHEPPKHHDYLGVMYLDPLRQYALDRGVDVKPVTNLEKARNCTVLIDTEWLTPDAVSTLKNNNCHIVGFNMVDSSWLAQACRAQPQDIDLIFSLTGIQRTNVGFEIAIDDDFNVTLKQQQFMEWEQWELFNMMRLTGRLLPLPYVHWETPPMPERRPYQERSQRVLLRGGAHFQRVLLALFLMRTNRLDCNSGFAMDCYFHERMSEPMRFCGECREMFSVEQKYPHHVPINRPSDCNSPAKWGGEFDLSNMGAWNNRCPRSFFWLAEQFGRRYGFLDSGGLETLFNGKWLDVKDHLDILGRVSLAADLKWLHSIYAAQRFWDAAMSGCVNLLPSRTGDQDYFPEMKPGEHYLPFNETFSNIEQEATIERDQYEHIAANTLEQYEQWIRPSKYVTNTALLEYIMARIL